MERLAFDTNAYSALQKGTARKLLKQAEGTEELGLPFIVVGELRGGFMKGSKTGENNRKLQAFLEQDGVSILLADEETTRFYAEIWNELQSKGKPVPTNDVWIAALCIQYGYFLASSDSHFKHMPLLRTVVVD